MVTAIITIIVGLVIAFILPDLIKFGDKKSRSFIQLVFNVIGVLIMLSGAINLVKSLV